MTTMVWRASSKISLQEVLRLFETSKAASSVTHGCEAFVAVVAVCLCP